MSSTHRVTNSHDSDDDEYWKGLEGDEQDEYWSEAAELAESVSNSPVKEGSFFIPKAPETPTTQRLADRLEASSIAQSGGARATKVVDTSPENSRYRKGPSNFSAPHASSQPLRQNPESTSKSYGSMPPPTTTPDSKRKMSEARPSSKVASSWSVAAAPKITTGLQKRTYQDEGFKKMGSTSSNRAPSRSGSRADPMEISDSEDGDMSEVIDTDTESSVSLPTDTRQNSYNSIFTAGSAVTSMTTLASGGSFSSDAHDLTGGRKRSFVESAGSTANLSPPKVRRTLDNPSTPTSNRNTTRPSGSIARSATLPMATPQRIYPDLLDEESPFRIRASPSTSFAQFKGTSELPAHTPAPVSSVLHPAIPSRLPPPASASVNTDITAQQGKKLSVSGPVSPDINLQFLDEIEGIAETSALPSPNIISSDPKAQRVMDHKKISWGVQWEIARGVASRGASGQAKPLWTWADITPQKLDKLRGLNAAAAWKVPYVILGRPVPQTCSNSRTLNILRELDREQLALMENIGRGLGLMGTYEGAPNWFGGQIQQIVRLNKGPTGFYTTMEPLESTRSHRFGRFLGSRRFVQMRIDSNALQRERDEVIAYLSRDFIICGRVFRPFTSKDDSVYLVETTLNHELRLPRAEEGDNLRVSYGEFIQWHNPLDRNFGQAISKWEARWPLGLSTSRPVLEFDESDIEVIDDIYSPSVILGKKPTAEQTMTDGCGFMNDAAFTMIFKSGVVNLPHRPISVQGRFCGAKGMWILHPVDRSPQPKIWFRLSQKKISLPIPLDRSHRIFELLCPSRVVAPSHLNMQVISNMSHNRVPDEAFVRVINEDLDAIIKPLTNWGSPQFLVGVTRTVHQVGRIQGARLQRAAPGSTRALGLGRDFHREEELDVDFDPDSQLSSTPNPIYSGRCRFSGAPVSAHENAYEMLLAGFQPLQSEPLYKKMKSITKTAIEASVKKYHVTILQSLEAYILPDPTGELGEGQVYFRSSQSLTDPETGSVFTTLLGEVIVGRNPTRLPSDLQKVTAVDCAALRDYYDVIIFSTKGDRSLASLLAGGDYDGDTAMLFWAKWLVNHFTNSALSQPPPGLVDEMFTRDVKSVAEFVKGLEGRTRPEAHMELRKLAFIGLVDSKVGLLSNFHDVAVYQHGYGSEKAQFNQAMDAQKGGLRLNPTAFKTLQRQYGGRRPDCMVHTEYSGPGFNIMPEPSGAPARRDVSQTAFVLDHLVEAGNALREKYLIEFEKPTIGSTFRWMRDKDLLQPHLDAKEWASAMTRELGSDRFEVELSYLESHVQRIYEAHQKYWSSKNAKNSTPIKPANKRQKSSESSSSATTELARQFVEGPEGQSNFRIPNLVSIKASYAYTKCSEFFAFSVAFRELCDIKAKASGHYIPTLGIMSEAMSVQPSFVRIYDERIEEF
ncbi:hypothetical protein HWV62_44091 [Athelia sp. TMB]|nr:hypothetical protein HWV62_44091 [Athelia sp. TMB]